eukprot:CAMPEP_0177752180 /NCGR_PEP_ID=MMETSP0491_2-20121128/779_1 /TAXON_ID=63592 /ORGANISM="Tetraselmis chuii, Strain PLY429" /LENGTH=401 /DNA_ID=CAMNT_0019267361 /DNA_START=146 /DNA_END=1351 /DNA_ORIENTATION=+
MVRLILVATLLLLTLSSSPTAHALRSLRQATQVPAISVDCGAGNIAINNQIGQSFVAPASENVDKVSVWMKPSLYYDTSYRMDLYAGEFASKLAETTFTLGASEVGTLAQFYDFAFNGVTLVAGQTYSWMLVRTSTYSGGFAKCADVIPGRGFWLGTSPEYSGADYSFELFTSPVPTAAPPPVTTTTTPAPTTQAPAAVAAVEPGVLVTIKSAVDDKCLIIGGNGNDAHPSRFSWGNGDFCGFPAQSGLNAKNSLIANKQAVWRLEKLTGNLYTVKSTVDDKCLIFGGNGNDAYPTRFDWGAGGQYCGFPSLNGMSSMESLLSNKQGVWEIESVAGGRFTMKSAVDGKCLIFGGNGSDVFPSRLDWGAGGEFCGFPAMNGMNSKDALLANKQGVFNLELLA